jgi:hypothetical protein
MYIYVCVCVVQGVVKHAWRQQVFGTGSSLPSSYCYPNLLLKYFSTSACVCVCVRERERERERAPEIAQVY